MYRPIRREHIQVRISIKEYTTAQHDLAGSSTLPPCAVTTTEKCAALPTGVVRVMVSLVLGASEAKSVCEGVVFVASAKVTLAPSGLPAEKEIAVVP